jgi:glycosyltransferase involved in cell wall biosynthesis
MFALGLDWPYGALPIELSPVATQEADVAIVPNQLVQRTLAAAGRALERIRVVPPGVDEAFQPDAAPLAEIVEWKGSRPAVLFRGGLDFRHGLDLLLGAALAARQQGLELCLVVAPESAADGSSAADLRELVQRFQQTRGAPELLLVERELSRAELAGLQRACDLLCHPYRSEGCGVAVLEARASGLPVLVTAGGGCDEFLSGPGAVRIPAQRRDVELPEVCVSQPWVLEPDAAALARLFAGCLRDLSRLGVEARGFAANVRADHPWASAAQAIERLASEAMRRRRGVRRPVVEPAVVVAGPVGDETGAARPLPRPALLARH